MENGFVKCLIFMLVLCLVQAKFITKNYCCLSCKEKHVMCKYPEKDKIGKNCQGYLPVNLVPEKVLHLCNRIKSVKGVFAGASDLVEMSWDYELEEMAQRWANQCPNVTDECRDTARGQVNQIVDFVINEEFVLPTWESVFLKWYIEEIPLEVIKAYTDGRYKALSQLIWGNTRWVGCAASSHLVGVGRAITLVCNYSPPGNIPSEKVFNVKGGMCTNCPKGSECSDKQNVNLCVPLGVPNIKRNNVLLLIANIVIFLSV